MSDSLWPHGLQHARPPCLSPTIFRSLLKFKSIALVMTSSHLILQSPLLLLPLVLPSIRDFSNESAVCCWWPKYWSFSGQLMNRPSKSSRLCRVVLCVCWMHLPAVANSSSHFISPCLHRASWSVKNERSGNSQVFPEYMHREGLLDFQEYAGNFKSSLWASYSPVSFKCFSKLLVSSKWNHCLGQLSC